MNEECRLRGHHRLSVLRASVAADVQRYLTKSPMNLSDGNTARKRWSAFFTPDVLSAFLYRVAHWLYANDRTALAAFVTALNALAHKVSIGPHSCVGPGLRLPHPAGVVFCGTAGSDLTVYALAVCGSSDAGAEAPLECCPRLGDRVMLGGCAVVLGPVRVGDDTKISVHVRLVVDAPPGALVVSRTRGILSPRSRPAAEPDTTGAGFV